MGINSKLLAGCEHRGGHGALPCLTGIVAEPYRQSRTGADVAGVQLCRPSLSDSLDRGASGAVPGFSP
jgi:hypothetical protein